MNQKFVKWNVLSFFRILSTYADETSNRVWKSTSSPGRFSLALGAGPAPKAREMRPGDEVVWKCICGIRDLTEIRCGRENAKYFDWKRDSAAPLGARFTNICVQEAGFFAHLSGVREDISSIAANARSNRLAFSSVSYESKLQWNLY